jgi:hypothetical protein
MAFLGENLCGLRHEGLFLLIPVGHPADSCKVPAKALERRPLDEVMVFVGCPPMVQVQACQHACRGHGSTADERRIQGLLRGVPRGRSRARSRLLA